MKRGCRVLILALAVLVLLPTGTASAAPNDDGAPFVTRLFDWLDWSRFLPSFGGATSEAPPTKEEDPAATTEDDPPPPPPPSTPDPPPGGESFPEPDPNG